MPDSEDEDDTVPDVNLFLNISLVLSPYSGSVDSARSRHVQASSSRAGSKRKLCSVSAAFPLEKCKNWHVEEFPTEVGEHPALPNGNPKRLALHPSPTKQRYSFDSWDKINVPCSVCTKNDQPFRTLRCHCCEAVFHFDCLDPPVKDMPRKQHWFASSPLFFLAQSLPLFRPSQLLNRPMSSLSGTVGVVNTTTPAWFHLPPTHFIHHKSWAVCNSALVHFSFERNPHVFPS
jgi:hypothetical protein